MRRSLLGPLAVVLVAWAACVAPPPPLPAELTADPRAGVDAGTGHAMRAVHSPSGVAFRLVPGTASTAPFYLAETELTVAAWRRFVAASGYRTDAERGVPEDRFTVGAFSAVPSGGREWSERARWDQIFPLLGTEVLRDDLPVLYVSAADAEAYVAHFALRLPTAAEWERAARASAATRYPWGDEPNAACRSANLQDQAGMRRFPDFNVPLACDDGFALVAPVASLQANALGFFDLIGNVEEWCAAALGTDAGFELVGGSWVADADGATLSHRASLDRHARRDFIGFRPALSIVEH